jgi:hypothetical protein
LLRNAFTSLSIEFRNFRLIKKHLVLFTLFLVMVAVLERYLVLPAVQQSIYSGDYWSIASVIYTNNTMTYLLIAYATYLIFYKTPLISTRRCQEVKLRDCWIWNTIMYSWRTRLLVALVIGPLLLIAITANSVRIASSEYHINVGIVEVITTSIIKVYGVFEYSGFFTGLLSQVPQRKAYRLIIFILGLLLLLAGSLIESKMILSRP